MTDERSPRLRHLLALEDLEAGQVISLLDAAEGFLSAPGAAPVRSSLLAGRTVANLFFEPSTRTRASFELAGRRLGADVLTLDPTRSSRSKGETVLDTVRTLEAMQVDAIILRTAVAGEPAALAAAVGDELCIVSAGEAHVSHPTQGLLDLLTIRQAKGAFEDLTVTIVGDVAHSRVARSAGEGLIKLGVRELRFVAPAALLPEADVVPAAKRLTDLGAGLDGTDVVMALRIQRERIEGLDGIPDAEEYFAGYGITEARLGAAPEAIVMHPGPMNRGVEIESRVADGPRSLIRRQVRNGVAARMAVLAAALGESW